METPLSLVEPPGKEPPVFMEWRTGAWIGVVVGVPLVLCKLLMIWDYPKILGWIEFALATPVLGLSGARFYQSAFERLRHWQTNGESWVTLCVFTSYAYSLCALTLWEYGYLLFTEAVLLVTVMSFRCARDQKVNSASQ